MTFKKSSERNIMNIRKTFSHLHNLCFFLKLFGSAWFMLFKHVMLRKNNINLQKYEVCWLLFTFLSFFLQHSSSYIKQKFFKIDINLCPSSTQTSARIDSERWCVQPVASNNRRWFRSDLPDQPFGAVLSDQTAACATATEQTFPGGRCQFRCSQVICCSS